VLHRCCSTNTGWRWRGGRSGEKTPSNTVPLPFSSLSCWSWSAKFGKRFLPNLARKRARIKSAINPQIYRAGSSPKTIQMLHDRRQSFSSCINYNSCKNKLTPQQKRGDNGVCLERTLALISGNLTTLGRRLYLQSCPFGSLRHEVQKVRQQRWFWLRHFQEESYYEVVLRMKASRLCCSLKSSSGRLSSVVKMPQQTHIYTASPLCQLKT